MAVRVDVDDEEESLVPVIKRRTTFERARATLSPFSRKWKETEGIRHFIIYALFILLFSLVVFNSKPGPIQYEIQAVHRQTLGAGMAQLKTVDMIYDWLKYNFSSTFFPYEDSKGSFLTANKRLTISGAGRVVSAARLRVVRAHQVECKIPNFLKEVNGRPVLCSAEYTAGNRIKEGMYATNSTKGIREDIAALNFTLPFEYRTASELETTLQYTQEGVYANYLQDGYALDIVPNVAPNVLAEYVSACMPNMVRSLEICKNQLLSEGTLVLSGDSVNVTDRRNYSTPEEFEEFFRVRTDARGGQRCPVEFDQNGETCVDMEELLVPPEMLPHLHRCQRVQELSSSCPLKYVGFAQMYELQRLDRCGSCKCMCDVDPVCSATCSAKDVYLDQMTVLQEFNWINTSTVRAVILDVPMLNPHENLMTMWRGVFELPPTGEIVAYDTPRTVKIYRYTTSRDKVYIAVEFMLLALLVYYVMDEAREIYRQRIVYFKDAWNCLDWINIILLLVVIGLRISSIVVINNFQVVSALSPGYMDYPPLAQFAITELNLLAFNFFLLYFKIFKYIGKLPKMGRIVRTIADAAFELGLFMIMAAIVLFGFSAAFYVCFGAYAEGFMSLGTSAGSLVLVCLGSFDYRAMSMANSTMAPLLFYLFVVVVFFILLSMFIAIIDDAFAFVKEQEQEKDLTATFNSMMTSLMKAFKRKEDINTFERALRKVDAMGNVGNKDGMVDADELRVVLDEVPNALKILNCSSAKELMERFDDSGDGMLDRKELKVILDLLSELEQEEDGGAGTDSDLEMDPNEWRKLSLKERMAFSRKGYHPRNRHELDFKTLEEQVDQVEKNLRDLAETVAKKLSLMVDLMVGLSDIVQTSRDGSKGG